MEELTLPSNLRKAEASDIVEGATIWYPANEYRDAYVNTVVAVRYPSDLFKAYVAEDGSRYGLDGAYVEGDA